MLVGVILCGVTMIGVPLDALLGRSGSGSKEGAVREI